MSKSHQYNLLFRKSYQPATGVTYSVGVKDGGSADLAAYLTGSDIPQTLDQIGQLPDNGNVKVGNTILPNQDFKELLQEWLEHIQPFSVANEVAKLRKQLQLPVTHIEFDNRYTIGQMYLDDNLDYIKIYAQLYINKDHIGDVQYMSGHFGPMYGNDRAKRIDWAKITGIFYNEFLDLISKSEPLAATLEVRSFQSLFVKDAEGSVITLAFCNYVDDEWQINLSPPDSITRSINFSVAIAPPKPDF